MKRYLTSSAIFTLALLGAPQAFAQTQAPPSTDNTTSQSETIVVRGVRGSLQSSQDVKRNADQVVDSVVAEDIGKLPDNNVIEALQHVTGVQVSRNAAEANQLLIRGLPDIATTLNGREIFTSTGRFITLQDIPAELLQRVDVEKSARADDIEGGIAGVIDVRLHRPFDFQGLEMAGGVHATYSSLSRQYDPDASALISNRWNTGHGEFGLLLDGFYSRRQYKEEILDNYISTQSIGPVAGAVEPPGSPFAPGTAFIPLTQGAQSINGDRERTALNFSAQWRPNNDTEFYLEGFWTKYRNPNNVDFFVGLPWICANPATATVFPGTNEVHTVTAGCYDLTSDQSFVPRTDTYQYATGGSWVRDRLTATTELDFTRSKFTQDGVILDTEYNPPSNGYFADFNHNGDGTPFFNVTGFNLHDPTQFRVRTLFDQRTLQKGHEWDWRGDLKYDVSDTGFIRQVAGGLRYANRIADNHQANGGPMDCGAGWVAPICTVYTGGGGTSLTALLPGTGQQWHATEGSVFDGHYGIQSWVDADPNWLLQNIGALRVLWGQPAGPPAFAPTNTFIDREITYSGYLKANFGGSLGNMPLDGNIGLRVVQTSSTMRGNTAITTGAPPVTTITPTTQKDDSTDYLPSLNARLTLTDDVYMRFGLSRTVTHPQFAQLNPGLTLSGGTATLLGSGSSGNPNLNPVTSDNADMTLEYYFGPQSSITGAVFYRRVDGYIVQAVNNVTVSGVTYAVTSPVNGPEGTIKGAEVGYTQFFDFLPGLFRGLGVQANATFVDGDFQNISKWSYNIVGIYEQGPVSMRLAYNWRDGFNVGPAPPGGQQPQTIFSKSQPWLDFSGSYNVNDRLTFTFDATNLLDSYYQDYFGSQAAYPRDTRRFDRTFAIGLRFRT